MQTLQHMYDTRRNERFCLSLLVLATGFVMTLQNPQALDSLSTLVSSLDPASDTSQIEAVEMHPQMPPPIFEVDYTSFEESETPLSFTDRERGRDYIRVIDLRATPERQF